jgi:hypothetical protein
MDLMLVKQETLIALKLKALEKIRGEHDTMIADLKHTNAYQAEMIGQMKRERNEYHGH